MTLKESVLEFLVSNGMFPEQAEQVFDLVKSAPENDAMLARWNDQQDAYPDVIMKMALLSAKEKAVEWIDENLPRAWYRPMFAN